MNEYELIDTIRGGLNSAERAINAEDHKDYSKHMGNVLDLLLEVAISNPPRHEKPSAVKWNPEQVLNDIATAIRYRTISTTMRWNIVHYYKRITCVPSNVTIPPQIILHKFTEKMVHQGFTVIYWNQLKQNLIAFYKELHK